MSTTTGKISWFGGPRDPSAFGVTASGTPTSQPGIAVDNRSTLGGYWMVKLPSGHAFITKQTDIGPAPWTGRKIDFTYSLLPVLGYTEKNFPTDAQASAVYLGKTINDVLNNSPKAIGDLNVSTDQPITPGPGAAQHLAPLQKTGVFALNFDALTPSVGAGAYTQATNAAANAALGTTQGVGDVGQALADIWGSVTTPALWKRVLYFIGGAVLIGWGLKELTGAHVPAAAKTAAKAAVIA